MIRGLSYLLAVIVIAGFMGILLLDEPSSVVEKIEKSQSSESLVSSDTPTSQGSTSDDPTRNGGSGGGSSSSGGGSSDSSQENNLVCVGDDVPHSLRRFTEVINCTSSDSNGCLVNEVYCSVDAYNHDTTASGTFTIAITVIDKVTEEIYDSSTLSDSIGPGQNKKFEKNYVLTPPPSQATVACDFDILAAAQTSYCN